MSRLDYERYVATELGPISCDRFVRDAYVKEAAVLVIPVLGPALRQRQRRIAPLLLRENAHFETRFHLEPVLANVQLLDKTAKKEDVFSLDALAT